MKLYIRNSKNIIKTVHIKKTDSVATLIEEVKKIYDRTDNIELIFNGIILNKDKKLSDYYIEEGNTIEFIGVFLG